MTDTVTTYDPADTITYLHTVPATELRDGDTVYVTGRWQTLADVDTSGPMVTARTDRGGILAMRRASSFARRI
jgi:hypothetical protein